MESLHGLRGLFGWHGVGQIHADERDIDVLERAHLRDAFGIAREIKTLATVGKNVSVAASLVVKELARRRTAFEVVGGNGFDGPVLPVLRLPIRDRLGGG